MVNAPFFGSNLAALPYRLRVGRTGAKNPYHPISEIWTVFMTCSPCFSSPSHFSYIYIYILHTAVKCWQRLVRALGWVLGAKIVFYFTTSQLFRFGHLNFFMSLVLDFIGATICLTSSKKHLEATPTTFETLLFQPCFRSSHTPPHDLQGVLSPFAFGSDGIRNAEKVHKNRVSYWRVGCTLQLHRFCWILKFTEIIYTPTKLTQNPRWLALLPDQNTEWDINATILCAYVWGL